MAAWGSGADVEATAGSVGVAVSGYGQADVSGGAGCGAGGGPQAEALAGCSEGDARSAAGAQPQQHPGLHQQAAAGAGPTCSSSPALDSCPLQPVLVLKKWQQLRPEREYRWGDRSW